MIDSSPHNNVYCYSWNACQKLCSWYFCPINLPALSMAYAISINDDSILWGAWIKLCSAPLMILTLSVLVWVTTACGRDHCNSLQTCFCSYSDDSYAEIRVITFLMPRSLYMGKSKKDSHERKKQFYDIQYYSHLGIFCRRLKNITRWNNNSAI